MDLSMFTQGLGAGLGLVRKDQNSEPALRPSVAPLSIAGVSEAENGKHNVPGHARNKRLMSSVDAHRLDKGFHKACPSTLTYDFGW